MVGERTYRAGLIRAMYHSSTESQPDEVLEQKVQEFESFRELPFIEKAKRRLTFRAPLKQDYDWSRHELAVRRGEVKPNWYARQDAFYDAQGKTIPHPFP